MIISKDEIKKNSIQLKVKGFLGGGGNLGPSLVPVPKLSLFIKNINISTQ